MVYHYMSNTMKVRAETIKDTYIATKNLVDILEEHNIEDIDQFLSKTNDMSDMFDYGGNYNAEINRELKYFQKYTEFSSMETSNLYVYEDIQFNTYDYDSIEFENELVEIRLYQDNFIDQHSVYDISDKVKTSSEAEADEQSELIYGGSSTLTIEDTNYNTTLDIRSEGVTRFTVMNVSEINWDIPTWGPDNIPIRFDTLTTENSFVKEYIEDGDESHFNYIDSATTSESVFEKTITISIGNRYSLYHDYLKNDDSIYDLTEFIVKGIFITPGDGVYYSSQKKAYNYLTTSTSTSGNMFDFGANTLSPKTQGHYLLYDSDQNGFFETVFIIAPIDNGVYNVISIGYNYDGIHDFIPYINPKQTFERINDADSDIARYNTYQKTDWDIFYENNIASQGETGKDYSFIWNNEKLYEINKRYAPAPIDGWIVKDQIVEIGKIAQGVNEPNRYTELYRDVSSKTYAYWHHEFDSIYWKTVWNEVEKSILPGTAAALVSMIPGYGLALSPIVYASIYFLETWIEQLNEAATMTSLQNSLTFYDIDSTKDAPNSLNEKVYQDRDWGDLDKSHPEHRSAYYYSIYGGEPGKDYSANLIIAPPRAFRGNGETFEGYNLDYFLLTSELLTLKDQPYITDVIIGTSPSIYIVEDPPKIIIDEAGNEVENIDYSAPLLGEARWDAIESKDERELAENLYYYYSPNTIGSLEQKIKSESNNELDTIRPFFTNGIPDYRFVNSKDIELTRTLSPLYSPIVVSQERYDQMRRKGEYRRSEIIIDLSIAISNWYTLSEISIGKYLAAGLKPRILLSNKGFEYPIKYVTIGYESVNPSDYEIKDGWLYLSPSIPHDFPDTFDLHVYFDTIVVGNTDTTIASDDTGRLALAQTISYSISDYFNQYYISATNAKRRAELQFTAMTTWVSTLLSTLILFPVTVSASLYRTADATIGRMVVSQLARIPSAMLEETFEELYLDPLIENFIKTRFDILGLDEDLGNFYSLLATSMREGLGGLGSFVSHDFSIDVSYNSLYWLSIQYGDNLNPSLQPAPQSIPTSSIGMTSIAAGGSVFGLLFGLASIGLDAYLDSSYFNVHMNAFMETFSGSQQQLIYNLEMDLATALAYQPDENGDSLGSVYALSGIQQQLLLRNINPFTIHSILKLFQKLI